LILRSEQIAERLAHPGAKDPLLVTPRPNVEELKSSGAASLDLRLGTWFVTLQQARMSHVPGSGNAPVAQFSKTRYVPFDSSYYLHPRSFVLGVTLEWIRLPVDVAGYVAGKSTWGRRGLVIATAVGVHPGFTGCLTLELSNVGEIPLELRPGTAICQLFLHAADPMGSESTDQSQFLGERRPTLGSVPRDPFVERISQKTFVDQAPKRV